MSHRTDWRVLATHDPIPGNAPELQDASRDYERIREALVQAQEELDKVITRDFNQEMTSTSVDEVRTAAKTVKEALGKIAGRYYVAANHLSNYAEELASAQAIADEAEREAQNAQAALDEAWDIKRSAERRRDTAQSTVNSYLRSLTSQEKLLNQMTSYSGDPDSAPPQWKIDQATRDTSRTTTNLNNARQDLSRSQREIRDAEADIRAAEAKINDARAKLHEAEQRRNAAARNAAQKIRSQINNDGQNDTWWDNWGSKIVDFIAGIASWVAETVGRVLEGLVKILEAYIKLQQLLADILLGKLSLAEIVAGLDEVFTTFMEGLSSLAEGIAAICGVIALVCTFLPIPGARIVAGLASLVGTIATAAKNVANISLGIRTALKTGDLGELKTALFGASIDIVLFGAGKVLGSVSKGCKYGQMGTGTTKTVVSSQTIGKSVSGTFRLAGKSLAHPIATINPGVLPFSEKALVVTDAVQITKEVGDYASQGNHTWNTLGQKIVNNVYTAHVTLPQKMGEALLSGPIPGLPGPLPIIRSIMSPPTQSVVPALTGIRPISPLFPGRTPIKIAPLHL